MLLVSSSQLKYHHSHFIFPIPRTRQLVFIFIGNNKKRKSGRFFSRSMLMRIRPKQFVFPRNYKLKKLKEAFLSYSFLTFVVYFSPVLFPFQLEKFCLLGAAHTLRPYIFLESQKQMYTPRPSCYHFLDLYLASIEHRLRLRL